MKSGCLKIVILVVLLVVIAVVALTLYRRRETAAPVTQRGATARTMPVEAEPVTSGTMQQRIVKVSANIDGRDTGSVAVDVQQLMTTMTTVLALMPLARAVVGGLAGASMITLLLIPVVFSLMHHGVTRTPLPEAS